MFISDRTRNKYNTCHTSSCIGLWNREHVFARSLANPSLTTFEPGPGTDVHNLRAADSQKNTQRSNRLFINGEGHSKIIDDNFYPGDEWKGDIARIIMYMYLRYPGQCEATNSAVGSITYAPENDMLSDSYLHENSITISPSLTKNLIKLHGVKESKFKVLIINQLGQIVIEIENERSIDVSNLNVGVYYLKLFHSKLVNSLMAEWYT